ncbi:PH (Pleckstrin Homology) domain-containing protein [Prauserella shujinwangii]|uniref:PH (Pleckstrin Homology) domain-containing protein n=1 Tax=Prauserella shujinwangii TaxID=1453103 RepID=A0A2T0LML7_9PSEU|nr:PH domain-containing protein [Prauserella shujinwangii]PRX44326.1 PH (Pleckstrin Homology) domain-containing protein [Prauserella shujinwangii]
MAYPRDLLGADEHVVVHRHPHFKMLVLPVFTLVVTLGLGSWLAVLASDLQAPWDLVALVAIGVVALVLLAWLVLAPFVRWRTTHFIVTTDRVIVREGVLRRTGIDIPMARINSVQFEHGLWDRVFGCGTLVIESAADEPLRFDDIPGVERVHSMLYRQVNVQADNPHDDRDEVDDVDDFDDLEPGPREPGEENPRPRGRRR